MAEISAHHLELLRSDHHVQEIWLSAFPKKILWTGQINDPEIVKGEVLIAWDNGATDPEYPALGFADVEPLQTLWVGTTPGSYNVGKLRIRDITSGDGGVTGIVKVGGHSLDLTNDLYLTWLHMYEICPMWPDIDEETETFYRDDDITYAAAGTPHDPPGPVLIAGPNRAGFLDPDTGEAVFHVGMGLSYIMAPGSTITTYQAEVVPNLATVDLNEGTITFTSVGAYWVKFSITDSNGRTQIGYRSFYVHSTDPTSEHYPITNFKVNGLSGSWDSGGFTANFELYDDADYTKIPDGTIIILFGDSYFNGEKSNINFLPWQFGDHRFAGYVLGQQIRHDNTGGVHSTVFQCGTPQEVLKQIYSYSVPLEAVDNPSEWNEYPEYLTPGRAARYVLEWHSTAFFLCDFLGLTSNPYYFRKYFEYTEGDMYSILNSLTYEAAAREKLICDEVGRFHLVRDLQLETDAVRAAATKIADFSDRDLGQGPLEIVYKEPTIALAWISGFSYDGALGEPEPWYALAPGSKPNRKGSGVANYERQTFIDQAEALSVAGRFWSRDNNPYAEVRLNLHGNYMGVFKPYVQEWWEINLSSSDTTRELIWTDKKLLCRGINVEFVYENDSFTGAVRVSVVMEPEAPPAMGVPWEYGELPVTDIWEDPTWETTNGGVMTAGSVWYLPPLSSTWVERSVEDTLDMHEDPYWPSKQGVDDSNQAIVWRCGAGYIKRTVDAGLNWTDVTPITDPTNYYVDSPAPTAVDLTYVVLTPNYSFSNEFVVGAYWYNGSAYRSWLAVTSDDGASWTWIPVL